MKLKTKVEIMAWLEEMGIDRYHIKQDLTINISGSVNLYQKNLRELPVRFNIVRGHFICDHNRLTSFEGFPKKVGLSLNISNNRFNSLEGMPTVGKNIDISNNKITSLEGIQSVVNGQFSCAANRLTTLIGGPVEVRERFHCNNNELTNLDGAPKIQPGFFSTLNCSNNNLVSIKGCSDATDIYCMNNDLINLVGLSDKCKFLIANNNQLISLLGCPDHMFNIEMNNNRLTSFKNGPSKCYSFECEGNPLEDLEGLPTNIRELNHSGVKKLGIEENAPFYDVMSIWHEVLVERKLIAEVKRLSALNTNETQSIKKHDAHAFM